jgi:hypothetical protein
MNTRRLEWRLAAFAILIWLAFVSNPELRVLLILVNSLGLELVFILIAIQLRTFIPVFAAALVSARLWCCVTLFFVLRAILRTFGVLMPGRALSATSALLYVLSRNLWCPLAQQSATSSHG